MYQRLYLYLQGNNILYRYQFGFRKNHSTALALIDVVDSIYQYLEYRGTAGPGSLASAILTPLLTL